MELKFSLWPSLSPNKINLIFFQGNSWEIWQQTKKHPITSGNQPKYTIPVTVASFMWCIFQTFYHSEHCPLDEDSNFSFPGVPHQNWHSSSSRWGCSCAEQTRLSPSFCQLLCFYWCGWKSHLYFAAIAGSYWNFLMMKTSRSLFFFYISYCKDTFPLFCWKIIDDLDIYTRCV